MFNHDGFDNFVLENDVVGFFEQPITLKSGRKSHFYVNWRKPTSNSQHLRYIANSVIDFAMHKELTPTCFLGVPEGVTKLGILTQYQWAENHPYGPINHCMPMLRSKPKEHGTPQDRYFVGAPEGNVVLIEDVTATGGSLISAIRNVKDAGVKIIGAIGLTNRMERRDDGTSVQEAIKQEGISYHHMSSALELLPKAATRQNTPRIILNGIEKEFERFGVAPLRFQQ